MKRTILDTAWYLVVFLLVQIAVNVVTMLALRTAHPTATSNIVSMGVSSVLTIALFAWRRWSPVNGRYLASRPWDTLAWVVCLAAGAGMPLSFIIDESGLQLPESYRRMFAGVMSHDLGYLVVGVLVPVAEEMVFRGAILRRLLKQAGQRRRWVAIAVTAALFGLVHGNLAQALNAFALGLILGWMYARTRSLVPGIVMHLTNNTIAFGLHRLLPGSDDMTLREFYGGDLTRTLLAVLFSLMIFGAALYQLNRRLATEETKI